MATGLRWTADQLEAHQARERARMAAPVPALLAPRQTMPGVDIDAAHRKAKYRNDRTVDEFGEVFDSKKEAKRARDLRLLLKAGEIRWWAKQVEFHLPGQTTYRADFVFQDNQWRIVVEDIKSPATRKLPAYRIKVRQMKEIHGIEVQER